MSDRDLAAALGYAPDGGIVDALFGDVTIPARVNQNIARQVQRSRQAFARPQPAQGARGAIDYAAGITAGLPIIGDLFGLGRDIAQFRAEPESRTPLNFGLAALGLIPFVPPAVSYGLGRFAKSRGVEIAPAPSGPAASQAGAIVYQGSPHKYDPEQLVRLPDGTQAYVGGKFNQLQTPPQGSTVVENFPFGRIRSEAIGTGEGAQAYGHGSYLAEAPEVADIYRKTLQGGPLGMKVAEAAQKALGTTYDEAASSSAFIDGVRGVAGQGEDAVRNAILKTAKRMSASQWPGDQRLANRVRALADNSAVVKAVNEEAAGSLYSVDLPDSVIARMLDWDKPLSQQPEAVREALYSVAPGRYVNDAAMGRKFISPPDAHMIGGAAYARTGRLLGGGDAQASDALRQAGIPGIRYLDGDSRSAGSGTSNFVVFPGGESALRILERNGVPVQPTSVEYLDPFRDTTR